MRTEIISVWLVKNQLLDQKTVNAIALLSTIFDEDESEELKMLAKEVIKKYK